MKKYSEPIVELVEINATDIIQTSKLTNEGDGGAIIPGSGDNIKL